MGRLVLMAAVVAALVSARATPGSGRVASGHGVTVTADVATVDELQACFDDYVREQSLCKQVYCVQRSLILFSWWRCEQPQYGICQDVAKALYTACKAGIGEA